MNSITSYWVLQHCVELLQVELEHHYIYKEREREREREREIFKKIFIFLFIISSNLSYILVYNVK